MTKPEAETILFVEHDPNVRSVIEKILSDFGFEVLVGCSAAESFEIEKRFQRDIDLLLVDVRIPETTGPDLGAALQKVRPNMHVMLISGFPGGDLLVLNYGWYFIQEHAVSTVLVERINDVLHTPRRDQGTDRFLSEPSILGIQTAV